MATAHVGACLLLGLLFASSVLSAQLFLLRSPLLLYNVSIGREHACPQMGPGYPQLCIDAIDSIYGHQDGEIIDVPLSQLCSEECLQPLEYTWKVRVHDEAMGMYLRNTLCQASARGYCAQQFILSSGNVKKLANDVDSECILKWCPLVCKEKEDNGEDYATCCAEALVGYGFQQTTTTNNMYGIISKGANKVLRQYDYCGQLLMQFQSDGKCLNIIELLDYIMKLVLSEDNLVNNEGNQKILKEGLESYCDSDCIQIVSSYYAACASVDEAVHQLFLFKMLYCAKDGEDFCLVKGLEEMEKGIVNKYKLRIYCIAPEFFCPRESCKKAINDAKSALGCCCQNLFNIEGSLFRDLIPEFIVRFMECQIELPKMCGCGSLTASIVIVTIVVFLSMFVSKYI